VEQPPLQPQQEAGKDVQDSDTDTRMFRTASEYQSFHEESSAVAGQLRGLLYRLGITKAPEYRIKAIPRPGRVEFRATVTVFNGPGVVSTHSAPALRSTRTEAVNDAAWQALTRLNRACRKDLKGSIYSLYPRRRKGTFKVSGVDPEFFKGAMVHSLNLSQELSTRLLAAQREIQSLRTRLGDTEATARGYQRMLDGQASDLYSSDVETWTATSKGPGSDGEPPVDSHAPSS
jgi:hypothetical protein